MLNLLANVFRSPKPESVKKLAIFLSLIIGSLNIFFRKYCSDRPDSEDIMYKNEAKNLSLER